METRFYLIAAIIPFGFIGLGCYGLSLGGVISTILGIIFLLLGMLIGIIVFGERWNPPFF